MPDHGCNDGLVDGFVDVAKLKGQVDFHVIAGQSWRVIHVIRPNAVNGVRVGRPMLKWFKARRLQRNVTLPGFGGLTGLRAWKSPLTEGALREAPVMGSGILAILPRLGRSQPVAGPGRLPWPGVARHVRRVL